MEFRYEKNLQRTGVRNITGYNQLIQQKNAEDGEKSSDSAIYCCHC